MTALDDDRAVLAGLRFARDSMTAQERRTLGLAEAMLRRIDAVLELHFEGGVELHPGAACVECEQEWPCETVIALGAVPAATRTR